MVDLVQLVERQIVALEVMGSIPLVHPISAKSHFMASDFAMQILPLGREFCLFAAKQNRTIAICSSFKRGQGKSFASFSSYR